MTTTKTKLDSIRRILDVRRSALDDLRRMPAGKAGSDWQRDRINDVEWANRQIEAEAARRGISPAKLVELAEMD